MPPTEETDAAPTWAVNLKSDILAGVRGSPFLTEEEVVSTKG